MGDWRTLPQPAFEEIIKDFSLVELKAFSTVCWQWNRMVDIFWKRKIVLNCSLVNPLILEKSSRHYENLYISSRLPITTEKLFQILQKRNLFQPNEIKSIKINHQKLTKVIEILENVGQHLVDLQIVFKDSEKVEAPEKDVSSLHFVKSLNVSGGSENCYVFSSNFKSLSKLSFHVSGNQYEKSLEILSSLCFQNKSSLKQINIVFPKEYKRESLYFLDSIENLQYLRIQSFGEPLILHEQFFKKSWDLVLLSLNPCTLGDQDVLDILDNFKNLKHLKLGIDQRFDQTINLEAENVSKIWSLPKLQSLKYSDIQFPNEQLLKTKNINISKLSLNNVAANEICRILPAKAPNLQIFKLAQKDYRILETFASLQNLKYLKVLHLNSKIFFGEFCVMFDLLEELCLGKRITEHFFDWGRFKAPNLRTLNLSDCSSWNYFTLQRCLKSCGNGLLSLQVKFFQDNCDNTVDLISKNSPNLENLKFGYMNWEKLLELLKNYNNSAKNNLKTLEMDFSKVDFFCMNEAMVDEVADVLKYPIRLCNMDENVHFGDYYTLVGDLIEIKLFVLPDKSHIPN